MGQQCWEQLLAPNQPALAHPPMEAEHTAPLQVAFSKDGAVPVPCTPVGLVQKLCVSQRGTRESLTPGALEGIHFSVLL